jgi:hypothetical protein
LTILTDKNLIRGTRLKAVNGMTVLDVLALFFAQLHTLSPAETHI